MLRAVLEMLLTLLAAVGMAFLLWLLVARRLLPFSDPHGQVYTLVRGRGGGEGVEQCVRELLWLRRWNLFRGGIVVVDCGLNEEGRALVRLLCANTDEVTFCDAEGLSQMLFPRQAEQGRQTNPHT